MKFLATFRQMWKVIRISLATVNHYHLEAVVIHVSYMIFKRIRSADGISRHFQPWLLGTYVLLFILDIHRKSSRTVTGQQFGENRSNPLINIGS